ncbi:MULTISPECIES: PleD family two-component system response regulator [unclassified Chelatococcus]|uniref:PleD family two-component system response regulator n=1 Tax=unclassified Chelatococcus TaxID=2638111 RepID=UPI001BD157B2|nr:MULTISPECIES: PleD family two-component system response regulator [unclassified Chelatococcus]MBS7698247.1 PleD family two-component system response regulator [Chelatococcus sp. YT9]MBX3559854.1 PleD family two-component system response regulator [Chelatococcus sp.]
MSARVLVVDDTPINVKLLEARLSAEYFDVLSASNGREALEICEQNRCDIVLLDAMMPGMDGFEVCRKLKSQPSTVHIPVVMVTALDQPSDRLRGLDAGADDFLTKPVDDMALIARVRSLVRLKAVTDELRTRVIASREFGLEDALVSATAETGQNARVFVIEDRPATAERLAAALSIYHHVDWEADPQQALARAAAESYDVILVNLDIGGFDGLRLCGQLRAFESTRNAVVLMMARAEDKERILRGLDIGMNDYLLRPVDRNELVARVRTQMRRKRFADRLRDSVQASLELAVIDPLTGLYNRRFLDARLSGAFEAPTLGTRPLVLLVLDIDHFKSVNDRFGHDAGDEVLKECASRIRAQTRGIDVVARFGGEEVVIMVPDATLEAAEAMAERIREAIEHRPFLVNGERESVDVTVSIGVAARLTSDQSPGDLLRRADQALYQAKQAGRNCVVAAAA